MEVKSLPHYCMHGRLMLTEFLHGSCMLWDGEVSLFCMCILLHSQCW